MAELSIKTERRTQLLDVTARVAKLVKESGVRSGICHLYVSHTTAGVIINEHDDPDVARDIEMAFDRLVPQDAGYRHAEGNSDCAHQGRAGRYCGNDFYCRWQAGPRTLAGNFLSANSTVRATGACTSKSSPTK